MTAATCLNQSANIFLQPSPFGAIELIKLTLKYSKIPVDILVLGTMTNIATAISEDRSIISKIGTLYFSGEIIFISNIFFIDKNCYILLIFKGGQFKSVQSYSSLVPNLTVVNYPYSEDTTDGSPNAYLGKYLIFCIISFQRKKI